MNSPLLTSTHWGVYEVETDAGRVTRLKPFAHDPDPSPSYRPALTRRWSRQRKAIARWMSAAPSTHLSALRRIGAIE